MIRQSSKLQNDITFPSPTESMVFTGERYVSGHLGPTQHAHHHRYLVSLPFCVNKDVLDVACGEGYGSSLISEVAKTVTGVDIDIESVKFAARNYGKDNLDFVSASASQIPFQDHSFDVVVSYETIEHIDAHLEFMSEVKRLLRPNGILVISSPNRPIYSDKKNHTNPFHIKELDLEEFRELLASCFKHVIIFAQHQVTGSLISSQEDNLLGLKVYTTEDSISYKLKDPIDEPQYFLALASNEEIEKPSDSVLINETFVSNLQTEKTKAKLAFESMKATASEAEEKLQKALQAVEAVKSVEKTTSRTNSLIEELLLSIDQVKKLHEHSIENKPLLVNSAAYQTVSYLKLILSSYVVSPLSRRQRRTYIENKLKSESQKFRHFVHQKLWNKRKVTWKLKAARTHPFSSSNRKVWRQQNPLESLNSRKLSTFHSPPRDTDPFQKGELKHNDSLNARLFENWVSNSLGEYSDNQFIDIGTQTAPADLVDIKLIAYYLPQFHPIPENDKWWGKGFTEWRNVARAFPNFEGHYQPRIPGELGYYDLRLPEVMKRQVELAKQHGISAFCFHFYWFAGKTLLEKPILQFLEDKNLNMQFSLCWANENWSRRWDGSDDDVLMYQKHSPEDDEAFLRHIERYFKDSRYHKVDGKPVLTVYRPSLFPEPKATVQRWRRLAREMGFPDLYLIATNSFGFTDYSEMGFDALSEFPPHMIKAANVEHTINTISLRTGKRIRHYQDVVESEINKEPTAGRCHPGITMGWDNSARKPKWGEIMHGATPDLFQKWLDHCVSRAKQNPRSEQLVFINAWNEWAEGTYLEPDKRFGYGFLDACGKVIRNEVYGSLEKQELVFGMKFQKEDQPNILLCAHHSGDQLFGGERSFMDVVEAVSQKGLNVYITLPSRPDASYLRALQKHSVEIRIFAYKQWSKDNEASLLAVPDFISIIRDIKAEIVYVNTIVVRSPLEAARLCGVKTITHAREIITADRNLQDQIGLHGDFIADIVNRSSDLIVANSNATALCFSGSRSVITVPNIVDIFEYEISNIVTDGIVKFGLISSNLPKKGVEDVIELARRCEHSVPNARFTIIGPLFRDGVVEFTSGRRKVPSNIEFVDYIPSPVDAVARVNVVLNFSHFQESFGRTILEAMAASRPVIVYDWGALPELVDHEVTGFIIPFKDFDAAIEAVKCLAQAATLSEMGAAARQKAKVVSDRETYNNQIGEAIQSVLDGNCDRRPVSSPKNHEYANLPVDIIICVHNALVDTQACLSSVEQHLSLNHRIIIIDDGSDGDTAAFLDRFSKDKPYVKLHRNENPCGYVKAANAGVKLSEATIVILLNSDTIVTHNWANKLAASLVDDPHVGIAGPMSNAASFQSLPSVNPTERNTAINYLPTGWGPEDMNRFCEESSEIEFPFVPLIHGFCLAFKREVWETVGEFDEEAFPRGFGEENDWCFRATDAGFGMVTATNTFIYHAKTKSYGEQVRHKLVEDAQQVLYARHGKARFTNAIQVLAHQPELRKLRSKAAELYKS